MGGTPWTNAEIEYLKVNYPQQSLFEISRILNRSYTGLRQKASRLGLIRKGMEQHTAWKGGRRITVEGYIAIRVEGGYQLEHDLVWNANHLEEPIKPGEVVHHINRIKTDNRPENLEKMRIGTHTTHHHTGLHYHLKKPKRLCEDMKAYYHQEYLNRKAKQNG